MKKNNVYVILLILLSSFSWAQTTETFETETGGATSFTDNGQVFNITSQARGPFDIQAGFPGTGWNGTASDNRYIDNDGFAGTGFTVGFTISSAGAVPFKLNSMYMFFSNAASLNQAVPGSLTLVGKLGGVTKFTATASSGFVTSTGTNNGFTFINLTTFGGSNNANTAIDQIVITTGGQFEYVALDAFNWTAITPLSAVTSATSTSCNGLANGRASVTASGGAGGYTYSWAPSGGTAALATGLSAGVYTVTVTDAGSTSTTATVSITQPSAIVATTSATNTSCFGLANGRASVSASGGVGGYTYSWAPSGGTAALATGLAANNYTVTVTDANNCTRTQTATVTQPSSITAATSATAASCNGGNNGRASVSASGGTPSYFYSWAPSGGTGSAATGLSAGNYTVTITDNNNCTRTATVAVTQPSAISTTTSVVNASCNGYSNGIVAVSASGGTSPYTYTWSPTGGNSPVATGMPAGSYTVNGRDNNGCTFSRVCNVTQPPALVASASSTNATCNGGSNGQASVSASGGTPGYTYTWTPSGGNNPTATGLTAGSYTCTIEDVNSCPNTQTVTIGEPTVISTSTAVTNVACNGGSNGVASVTASGGTGAYTYSWTPSGGTAATATGLAAGNYTVTITDANNCTKTAIANVTQPTALVTSTAVTNVACNGGSNGVASISVSGGAGGYSYLWSTGSSLQTITGLMAGVYTATVTDANGCKAIKSAMVTQPSALVTTTAVTSVACNGGSNGVASVSASGGAGGYSYLWSTGSSLQTITGLMAGVYTATVTDVNSCISIKSAVVTQPSALVTTTAVTNVACNGGSTGVASVTTSGGAGGYSYIWSNGASTSAITGLMAGVYTATVTDANSCTSIKSAVVTQPTAIVTNTAVSNVTCNGGSNGTATVTPGGGTGGYTYSWVPSGGTAAIATGLAAGNYTVTVTDANNCTKAAVVNVTQPTAILTSTSVTNVACNGGSNGVASVSASGGTGVYTYSWTPGGGTTAAVTGLVAGNYTVTVTDANSCTKTAVANVTQPAALATSTSVTNVSCNGGSNGAATVSATGGAGSYTYSWTPSGGISATASGLAQGNYTVTVTDANSCTKTAVANVTQPTAITATPSQTNATCGTNNGVASVTASGGTGAYTYSWTPSGGTAATATGLGAGNYTVAITDANACVKTQTFNISLTGNISGVITTTAVSCNGGNNGVASVSATGGAGAYTYTWMPGNISTATATGLSAGTYTVQVRDAVSCTVTFTAGVSQPAVLTAGTTFTNVTCNGAANGIATASVSGGTGAYTYTWSPAGGNAATASGLGPNTYTVDIKDANNCAISRTVSITQPVALSASITGTNVSCNGGTNGTASVTVSGGTGAYTYSWTPTGGTAATATGLAANNYTVTVKDANLCTITRTITLTEPAALTAVTSQTNLSCNGSGNGAAAIVVSGGTGAYTYSWTPSGGTASTATGLVANNYTVTVRDANNCSITRTYTITQPAVLAATASNTNIACNGAANGIASVSASGGTGAYTYSWTPGAATSSVVTGLNAGTYTVTVKDANLCQAMATVSITQPTALSATISGTNTSCNGGTNGTASVTASGGTGAYTYSWTPTGGTAATATGLGANNYTVTVKDANLCTLTRTIALTEPASMTAVTSQTNLTCNGSANGTASITVSGGAGAYTYSWTPAGGTASAATGLAANNYTVTVRDANNCSIARTYTITQPATLIAVMTRTNITCNGSANGIATASVSGGTGAYTYSWTPGVATTSVVTGLNPGAYTVTVKDANLCQATGTVSVTEPAALVAVSSQTNIVCNGTANGSASVTVSGGTSAYSYTWSPAGGNASSATGLTAGSYSVTVKDANNCMLTHTLAITQPAAIVATLTHTNISCFGLTNGSASVTATGGTGALTYTWMPGSSNAALISGLSSGTYTVNVKDASNCQVSSTVAIIEPAAIAYTQSVSVCQGQSVTVGTSTYSVAGTYTNVLVATGGCDSTVTTVLTINAPPTLTLTASSSTVCAGTSATLTATGATTYTWTNGVTNGVGFTPAVTQTYTVTGANGACSTSSTISIHVNSRPSVVANTTATLICKGNQVTLSGGGATSYTWTNGVINGTAFSPTTTATYTVTGTNASGCTNTAAVTVSVNPCTGIDNYSEEMVVMVYPNPVNSTAVVNISHFDQMASGTLSLDLYDNAGRKVKHVILTAAETVLSREGLADGIYYYHVTSNGAALLKGKLIVQ